MQSRVPFPFPAHPVLGWLRFSLGYAEMLQASAVVIHHRVGRMGAAGPYPGVRDQREFTRMVQEKPQAVAESLQALTMKMMALNLQQSTRLAQQMTAAGMGMLGWWMAPGMRLPALGQDRGLLQMMQAGALQAARLSQAYAGIASGGLAPIRSRATANARRLVYLPALRRAGKLGTT